jgi:hypothetical protein
MISDWFGETGKVLGTVTTGGNVYAVIWHEGDRISIPMLCTMIATYTRNRDEALAICRRNLRNFVER